MKGETSASLDGACCKGRAGLRRTASQVIVREFAFNLLTGLFVSHCPVFEKILRKASTLSPRSY